MNKHFLVPDGRFSLRTDADIPADLEECAHYSAHLDIIDTNDNQPIARLRGSIAARLLFLFHEQRNRRLNESDFNCFGALNFVTGKTDVIEEETSMREKGKKMYVNEARRDYTAPFVFQICGSYQTINGKWVRGVIHAGLIINDNDWHQEPIVFEKDAYRRIRILPWDSVWRNYFPCEDRTVHAEYVTCASMDEFCEK
ncbi:MAG TPA: hypothetical protein VHA78_06155 [Candidatus Peribacteraceae bacterium]|nr:hypothetical protein [Candidatus Peribacteraceae bacterium]